MNSLILIIAGLLIVLWVLTCLKQKKFKIEFGNAQYIGNREEQEDSFGFSDISVIENRGLLAVIADGMGGLSMGKEAGVSAVSTILKKFEEKKKEQSMFDFLNGAVAKANDKIVDISKGKQYIEIGTTVVAITIEKNELHWASVGDSRLYILRKKNLKQLTKDHIYGNYIKDRKKESKTISIEELERRNELTSFLGAQKIKEMNYNLEPFYLKKNDVLLMCTDGIYDTLSEGKIKKILELKQLPNAKAEKIVEEAKQNGIADVDNMTAIVLELR